MTGTGLDRNMVRQVGVSMQEGKLCPNLFTLPAASASPHTFRQHTATFSGWFLSENLSFCPYWRFTFGIADMLTVYMASVSGSLEVQYPVFVFLLCSRKHSEAWCTLYFPRVDNLCAQFRRTCGQWGVSLVELRLNHCTGTLDLYWLMKSFSFQVKKNQERIFSVLTSKKIAFKQVDITQNTEDKNLMRKKANNPTALPPQIFNGDVYCGVSFH